MTLVGAAVPTPRADDAHEELTTIEPYSDTLGALRRVGEEGVMIAVASNLALPSPSLPCPFNPAEGFAGQSNVSFDAGAIKPDRAFYAGLKALLGCDASKLLMLFNMWRDDIDDTVEAGSCSGGRSLGPCFSCPPV